MNKILPWLALGMLVFFVTVSVPTLIDCPSLGRPGRKREPDAEDSGASASGGDNDLSRGGVGVGQG